VLAPEAIFVYTQSMENTERYTVKANGNKWVVMDNVRNLQTRDYGTEEIAIAWAEHFNKTAQYN
jgi:hypothetical protein